MRFAFDPEQRELAAALRDYLRRECGPADVAAGPAERRWRDLAEMGVVGLLVTPERGGLGMDEVTLALLLEEAGRAALPEPLGETAAVALPLLETAGAGEALLRRVAAGEATVALGLEDAPFVRNAERATLVLLQRGGELHLLDRDRVALIPLPALDPARPLARVTWDPMEAGASLPVGPSHVRAARDRGALAAAAELVGLAAAMIEMAAAYATQREQFGRPIGSFQAVKHRLASAYVGVEFARPAVYRAAWSVANGVPERGRDVSMAKALASDAAVGAARAALQVHGAIGYTQEHHLHHWLKRTRALASAWGTAAWHRDRVARRVLGWPAGRSPRVAATGGD